MMGEVLVFLKQNLDEYLKVAVGGTAEDADGPKVVFVDGDKFEPITFKLGAVTMLLVNVEEERLLRNADPYIRTSSGTPERVQPDIRLILHVLFIARFKQYEQSWDYLSKIIQHYQTDRVFDAETSPGLPSGVGQLILELQTMSFAEQNEVWNALRTTHHPSILYRVKLLTFRDRTPRALPQVSEPSSSVRNSA